MATKPGSINQGGFLLFLAAITLATTYVVWPFAAPLMWATLAAIMFQPLYQWLLTRMKGRPNQAAITCLLIITFAVLVPGFVIGGLVVDEATGILGAFQRGEIDVSAWFTQIFEILPAAVQSLLSENGWDDFSLLQERLQQFIGESAGLIAQQAVAIGGGIFGFVLAFTVGLYVTYFLLRDGKAIGHRIVHDLPLENSIAKALSDKFLSIVRATIKGSVVVGLVQGFLGAITFWIAGLPSVVLFGMLMATP